MARRKLYVPVMLAAAVAVACAMLVVLVVSEKAEATFPGKNGRIAYAGCNRANDYEIYTINARGGGKSRVTNDDAYPYGHSWGSRP